MTDPERTREAAAGATSPVAAPHGSRLVAFCLDLVVVLAVGLAAGGGWLRTLAVFVAYHTALVWLTGQTVGKAVANLEVRRVDGARYVRTSRGLLWALGRASVGYLLVDVLGLGLLVALPRRNAARRCAHDWVFASQVVLRGEQDWAVPRIRERLADFARRREDSSRQVKQDQEEPRRLLNLWHWLVTGALALEKVLDRVQGAVAWLSRRLSGTEPVDAAGHVLSTKATAGVLAGTAAATVGTVVAVATLLGTPAEASPLGLWGNGRVAVEQTGSESYAATILEDFPQEGTGCVFEAGVEWWRLQGAGPHFEGEALWSQGDGRTCTTFEWGHATFELMDQGTPDDPADDVLLLCSTSPFSGREECREWSRG